MVLKWQILEVHFMESLCLVCSDIIKSLLEQILVISDGFHVVMAPIVQFLHQVIWVDGSFFLFSDHAHFVGVGLPKTPIVVGESALDLDGASALGNEFEVDLITFVEIVLVVRFGEVKVPLFSVLLMNEFLDFRLFQKFLGVSALGLG